jgi:hypothetical protein
MNYTKPEVVLLGSAVDVICGPKTANSFVDGMYTAEPAYELDEE